VREPLPPVLEPAVVERAVAAALAEDLGWGDVTTEALVPREQQGRGVFLVKGSGVVCGLSVAEAVFRQVDPRLRFQPMLPEGSPVERGALAAHVEGSMASILKAERTALNFLQRLSGVASETAAYVAAVDGLPVRIIDTRKTTPGLRALEKYAVRVGGGHNHRAHLGDGAVGSSGVLSRPSDSCLEGHSSVVHPSRPSCCSMPAWSHCSQRSTTRSPDTWSRISPPIRMRRPVGLVSPSGPVWVPSAVHRVATLSAVMT